MDFEQVAPIPERGSPTSLDITSERQFTCFPDLPKEIRLLIWEFALPGPRLVDIRKPWRRKTIKKWEAEHNTKWHATIGLPEEYDIAQRIHENALRKNGDISVFKILQQVASLYITTQSNYLSEIKSDWLPPGVFFASRESYSVALSRYTKAFSCLDSIPQTWFNFDQDILYIRGDLYGSHPYDLLEIPILLLHKNPILDVENLCRVKHLAIELDHRFLFSDIETPSQIELILAFFRFIFRGLEKISCILEHHSDGRIRSGPLTPSSMVEPVDFAKARLFNQHVPNTVEQHLSSEAPLLDLPEINLQPVDIWWGVLTPEHGPCPTLKIEFRVIFEPHCQKEFESLKQINNWIIPRSNKILLNGGEASIFSKGQQVSAGEESERTLRIYDQLLAGLL